MLRTLFRLATTLVVAGAFVGAAYAQSDQTIYVEVDYMRSTSPDYAQIESDIWKPIHQERIDRGLMLDWALYGVRLGDRQDYDYVTINIYDSMEDVFTSAAMEEVVRAAHPNRSLDEITESVQSRQLVRSELWSMVDGVWTEENAPAARFLSVAYMDVPEGGVEAYLELEQGIWKPMHELSLGHGGKVGWGLYALNLPSGTNLPYNYATVNEYTSMGGGLSMQEAAQQVHPNVSIDDLGSRTMEARDLVSGVLLERVDSTD